MTFLINPQELKTGLIIFRRADVKHRKWYCRVKLPETDRYKTVCLKTVDIDAAKERAFDEDADLRFRIKHNVPIFNRPFSAIAKDFLAQQKERAEVGEITQHPWETIDSVIHHQLNRYVGSIQINQLGQGVLEGAKASIPLLFDVKFAIMHTARDTRSIRWIRGAQRDFADFPEDARLKFARALTIIAEGRMPDIAKPLTGLGSSVMELALKHRGDAFRVVYALQIGEAIWVVHAFQKKAMSGIATPKHEIDVVRERLKRLKEALK